MLMFWAQIYTAEYDTHMKLNKQHNDLTFLDSIILRDLDHLLFSTIRQLIFVQEKLRIGYSINILERFEYILDVRFLNKIYWG